MPKDEYTCALCKQTFTKGWSDEEALAELKLDFPGFATAECSLVCDGCYQQHVAEPAND